MKNIVNRSIYFPPYIFKQFFISDKYKYGDGCHAHVVTYTILQWIDFHLNGVQIFSLKQSSLPQRGLEVYCIMSSPVHLIIRAAEDDRKENVARDLKGYTSKAYRKYWRMK